MNETNNELVLPYIIEIPDSFPVSDYISEICIYTGNTGTVMTRIKMVHMDVYYQVTSDITMDFMMDINEDTEFESLEIPYPDEVVKILNLERHIRTDTCIDDEVIIMYTPFEEFLKR